MKIEEKAKELVEKMRLVISQMGSDSILFSAKDEQGNDITDDCKIDAYIGSLDDAKSCAIICVDQMLDAFDGFMDARPHFRHPSETEAVKFWLEVKKEIEKIKT